MKTSNDTSALTGLPGSVMIGVPLRHRTLRHAGLHRHLDEVHLPAVESASFYDFVGAGAHAAGGDDQVGVAGVAFQASRNSSTSSPVIGAVITSAPASRIAAASITAFDS